VHPGTTPDVAPSCKAAGPLAEAWFGVVHAESPRRRPAKRLLDGADFGHIGRLLARGLDLRMTATALAKLCGHRMLCGNRMLRAAARKADRRTAGRGCWLQLVFQLTNAVPAATSTATARASVIAFVVGTAFSSIGCTSVASASATSSAIIFHTAAVATAFSTTVAVTAAVPISSCMAQ